MKKKYSEMTKEELFAEMQHVLGEKRKKEQAGFISEANILEQKFYMAKSYLTDPETILTGQKYQVEGIKELFSVRYLNGVMAWGKFPSSTEEVAIPIGRLSSQKE